MEELLADLALDEAGLAVTVIDEFVDSVELDAEEFERDRFA